MKTSIAMIFFCLPFMISTSDVFASESFTVPLFCEMTSKHEPDIYKQKDELRFNLVLEDIGGELPYCWFWQWGDRDDPIVGDAMICMKYVRAQNVSKYVDMSDGVLEIQPDGSAVYDLRDPDYPNGLLAEPVWVVTRYTGKCAKGVL